MEKKCFAKINLTLDNLYKRADGYHQVDMLMARVNLFDRLIVKKNGSGDFNFSSNISFDGPKESNLVYRAWELLRGEREDFGVDCYLEKNIPLASGLGGGSTDGVQMMKILNDLFDLGFSKDELRGKSLSLGADFPFFFEESPCRCEGVGEILTPFAINMELPLLLINDGTRVSSKEVYKKLKDYGCIDNPKIMKDLESGRREVLGDLSNVMEEVVFADFPNLLEIKKKLTNLGAEVALMSGSGGTIFGIFKDQEALDRAYENMQGKYDFVRKAEVVNG